MFAERRSPLRVPESEPAVAELESPLRNALRQAAPRLRDGTYGLIIGDDTSGRVPAVIVHDVVRRLHEQRHHDAPPLVFLPGGGGRNSCELQARAVVDQGSERLRRLSGGRRALLVTDTVQTGSSVAFFAKALADHGIAMDVLAVAVFPQAQALLDTLPDVSVYAGSTERRAWAIDGAHHISGVNKFFTPTVRRDMHSREHVIAARREAHRVAGSLSEQLQ